MLAKLVPDIKKTAQLVEEISAASREQDAGACQVNQAIQQLDRVIQQNTGASEQMSATSEELAAQAELLQDSISFFRIGDRVVAAPGMRPQAVPAAGFHMGHTPAAKSAKPAAPGRTQATARATQTPHKERNPGASATARAAGTLIDLGADEHDASFERY
jgi:methyl-accepting chemotaxis protein